MPKNTLILLLFVLIYINRGLFVAAPGFEVATAHPSGSDVNSLLEFIINLTGECNDLDEDGDSPESYNVAQAFYPIIDHCPDGLLTQVYSAVRQNFGRFDEAALPLYFYGTIDQPPELVV